MQVAERIIKVVDRTEKPVTIAPDANRDFWLAQRRALLAQVAAIEEILGIHRQPCRCQVDKK